MWAEWIDGSKMLATLWPRAAAVAERLWSPRNVSSHTEAAPRLRTFRCLLLQRGVHSGPVGAGYGARDAPHGPGGCSDQA